MKNLLISLVMVVSVLIGSVAYAAVQDDSVLSAAIKEADGVSGQDTNSGSGIKAGHIQDGAVSSAKIADGAVTDGKITGPISSSKIESSGLDADTVDGKHASELAPAVHVHDQSYISGLADALAGKSDIAHNHDAVYQRKYGNVLIVAVSGGDFTNPISAIDSIVDASASNPYLIKIMPGYYDIGSNSFYMKPFVDIEGSGQTATRIVSTNAPTTIVGSSDAEIRMLSVECTTGDVCIYNQGSTRITNVTVSIVGQQGTGSVAGIKNVNSSPVIVGVTVKATLSHGAKGVENINATPVIIDSDIYAGNVLYDYAYGMFDTDSDTYIYNTRIVAEGGQESFAIYHSGTGATLKMVSGKLDVYSGGTAYSIRQDGGLVQVSGSLIEASGEGGYHAQAALVYGGVLELNNTTVTTNNIANNIEACDLLSYGTGATMMLNGSTLNGANWHAVCSKSGAAAYVGNSKINGGTGGSDSFLKCFGSYDENYDPFTCSTP